MKRRIEELVGGVPGDVDGDLPRGARPDPPPRGRDRSARSNSRSTTRADQEPLVKSILEELELDPKRFAARDPRADLDAKNGLVTPGRVPPAGRVRLREAVAEVYRAVPGPALSANAIDFDDLLMMTVQVLGLPERASAGRSRFRYVLVDEYQDTNHAQYRCCPLLAGRGAERLRRRRSRPVDLRLPRRRHPEHPRVRAGLPRSERRARAELPLDEPDPRGRQRRHRQQSRAEGQGLWSDLGEGEPVGSWRSRTSTPRPGSSSPRSPDWRRTGSRARRDRRLLSDERAVPGGGGPPRPQGHAVSGDRRAALLRAGRDQGRRRVPPGDRQPGGLRLARTDREPAPGAGSATRRSPGSLAFADAQEITLRESLGRADEAGVRAAPLRKAIRKLAG